MECHSVVQALVKQAAQSETRGEERRGEVLKFTLLSLLKKQTKSLVYLLQDNNNDNQSNTNNTGEFQICISNSPSCPTEHKTCPTADVSLKTCKASFYSRHTPPAVGPSAVLSEPTRLQTAHCLSSVSVGQPDGQLAEPHIKFNSVWTNFFLTQYCGPKKKKKKNHKK